jgi:secreted trypsin-like serine protease
LNDTYFGIGHDAPTEDVNVAAQGIAGRLCGNDKKRGTGAPHIFTNVDSIKQYLEWIDAKGDFTKVKKYNSRQLKVKKGRVKSSRETVMHESNVELYENPNDAVINHDVDLETFLVYTDEKTVKSVCDILGKRYIPVRQETDGEHKGYRITSLNTTATKVSLLDAIKKVPSAYGTNSGVVKWRVYLPCYKDIDNPASLHFVVILEPGTDATKIQQVKATYPSLVIPKRGLY